MGDRTSIAVIDNANDGGTVWHYSHWGGHRALLSVAKALTDEGTHNDAERLNAALHRHMHADAWTAEASDWVRGYDLLGTFDTSSTEWIELAADLLAPTPYGARFSAEVGDSNHPLVGVRVGTYSTPAAVLIERHGATNDALWGAEIPVADFLAEVERIRATPGSCPHDLWRIADRCTV